MPENLDDAALERLLFPEPALRAAAPPSLPHWPPIHLELKRKGVTLTLLWDEYKQRHPEGLQYSRFCELYREWRGGIDLVMRQEHLAGEKLFVDYCGYFSCSESLVSRPGTHCQIIPNFRTKFLGPLGLLWSYCWVP
ncbi:putative ISPsy14, transposase [Magnetofaba australis IT-1]|uniref:Putative ISPsy14, transposase n=1 Tax=Magnetofaba australis IT-1 TaxID=1434232 RepID=A0A1Y2K4Z4_9PROT|nr:putative ISPsy14, transposase [Magnetofaba australis IT-1]